ncbi:hypothetical protein K2173_003701 [Erythroxylum novogranatense]|uniref:Uncharacterized protein n=1 Tax=Erythroxylum novogranatense TaxID=1862640 RepID=A0AAV8TD43_9ROSI|nr:hypothetical protein K2173_003701 [Erythroxylum novogranatense]
MRSEVFQEQESLVNNDTNSHDSPFQDPSLGFNLLRLDNFCYTSDHHHHHPYHPHAPCTTCGCCGTTSTTATTSIPATISPSSSNKRRSPESTAPTIEDQLIPKKPKKLFFSENSDSNRCLHGFSKISLPFDLSGTQTQTLQRTMSDPTSPPPVAALSGVVTGAVTVVPQSPSDSSKNNNNNNGGINATTTTPASKASSKTLPPRPTPIRRTVSDPSPANTLSRSSSCDDASNSLWLKKMKDCIKQMNQWWDEYMPGEQEEDERKSPQDNSNNNERKNDEGDDEEAVSVEKAGDCFMINFRCPCRKGYQILLSGRSCYYRLL